MARGTARSWITWTRGKRTPVAVGGRLPVIFCTWRRLERLPCTLHLLAAQDLPVQALIWNNSAERRRVEDAAADACIPVAVHHSGQNVGGFGRFYLAREAAAAGHQQVVFIDDDQRFAPHAVSDLLAHHRRRSISGSWAFRLSRAAYWDRTAAAPGEIASYVGTGGMIADSAVFEDPRVFRCPRRFWFVEDLWLCFVANHLAGYELFKSPAQFDGIADGRDQFASLREVKQEFLEYLIRRGWQPPGLG